MGDELSVFAKKRKRKKLIRSIALSIVILALVGTGAYFALTKYLVVETVNVRETSLYSAEALLEAVSPKKGTALVAVSKKDICRKLEENFPYLVEAQVEFDLPNTVNISFTEDFGELELVIGQEAFCIDKDLNVLAKEKVGSDIPRIRLYSGDVSRCIVGEKLTFFEEDAKTRLKTILSAMENTDIMGNVQSIDIRDKFNIRIRYLDRFDLLVGDENNMKHKFLMVKEVVLDLNENDTGTIDIADPDTAYVKIGEKIG